jgi:hypothetical protein
MSNIVVSASATGAGVITLAAPVTATNRTITLPDATGTLLSTATTENFPAGSVRQVVSGVLSSTFTTTSSSDVDTGLSATITPTSSTSKILVLVSTMLEATATGGGNCYVYQKLWRGAVSSGPLIHDGYAIMGAQNTDTRGTGSVTLLDSPATTSAVTYRVSLNKSVAGTSVKMNATTSPSTITLIEVSA